MTRRTLVLLTAVVLSIALVAPGIAQQGDGPSFDPVATIAKEGFKKTKKRAKRANKRLDEMQVASAKADALVTATVPLGSYQALGGPEVTVTVPKSGLIEVWAQVEIKSDDGGAVGLYQDGAKMSGIGLSDVDFCGDDAVLIQSVGVGPGDFDVYATPPSINLVGCAGTGAPVPVLLETTPGKHTYELRYSECVCGFPGAEFRNRVLRVATRP